MDSLARTEEVTLQEEVETLQKQLAESESRAATFRATIEQFREVPAFSDLDYERIAVAMQRLQSRDRSPDRSVTAALSESTRRSPKQPDPPLLSDGKDPTYTS